MRQFSTVELTQKIGDVTYAARREPVAITHHRKARFVLMSIDDYERLLHRGDTRQSWRIADVPDELAEEIQSALSQYESEQQ